MSARRLQQEMERVFKRVAEGIQIFNSIYDKLQMASNQSQKEKLEQDLKREIKKLQKLRDQIKTWLGSNEVRDKKQLSENRRLIENEMERFKVVEREVKTKAFSREGLNQLKDDPHAKEKRECTEWLQMQIEELEGQIENLEQESDSLQGSAKKSKKDSGRSERIAEIDHSLERHKWHIEQMDRMVRMIENDTLAPESVMEIQDDIQYYVESNQEVDFAEDEAIYEELNLVSDDEDVAETIVRDDTYTLEDLAQDLSKEAEKEAKRKEKEKDKEPFVRESSREPEPKKKSPPPAAGLNPLPPPKRKPGTPVPGPAATSASSPVRVDSPVTSAAPQAASTATVPTHASAAISAPSPATTASVSPGTAVAAAAVAASSSPVVGSVPTGPVPNAAPVPVPVPVPAASPAPAAPTAVAPAAAAPATAAAAAAATAPAPVASPSPTPVVPPVQSISKESTPDIGELPIGLQDLMHCFDSARERLVNAPPVYTVAKLIESSYINCPDSMLADQPRYYHPESPYPTPDYYPGEVLATLEDPEVFSKMDVDTLFYIFYYRQGTHQQYLAAKELKHRSWRFHKRFLTWFQRYENPKIINAEYEQGTYRFFDFEGSWLQRRKTNFKFEYQFLEDEI